jgi:hypothetical protein
MEKANPSHEQEERATALLTKYGDKKLTDLQSLKKMYWLLTDQIIPSRHNFRAKVKEKHEQDWKKSTFRCHTYRPAWSPSSSAARTVSCTRDETW